MSLRCDGRKCCEYTASDYGLFEEHYGKAGHDGVSASSTTGLATILHFALAFWEKFAATTMVSTMKYTCSLNIGIIPASMDVVSIDSDIFRMLRHWSMCLFFRTGYLRGTHPLIVTRLLPPLLF